MRLLFVVLVGLLVLIQYPLWLGQGSWSRVWRLDQSLALQREVNAGKRLGAVLSVSVAPKCVNGQILFARTILEKDWVKPS